MRKTDVLVYTGGAATWEITKEQWQAAGVEDQDTVRFTSDNRTPTRVGDLSESAFELLMDRHGNEFRIQDTGPKHNADAAAKKEN